MDSVIELLKDEYIIKCVEYSQIAWTFVVQRNKIIELLDVGHFD